MRRSGCRPSKYLVVIVIALACGLPQAGAIAQAAWPAYTLDECLAMGLQRSGRLRNAQREELIAETTIGGIRSQILPQLTASASYTRMDELETVDFGETSIDVGSLDNYAAGVTLRQLLYAGGSVRAGLLAAKDYRDMTAHQTHRMRATLERDIRAAFSDLLLLDAIIRVHEQRIAQLRDVADQTTRRFERDQASEFDALNARVQLANAMPLLIRASNDWSLAHTAFANLIEADDTAFTISGELEYRPFDAPLVELIRQALETRPDIWAVERQLALQRADIRVEQGAYLPTIHASAGYRGQDPPGMISSASGWDWRWTAGLEAQWRWMDGGLRRQQVRRKRLEYDQSVERHAIMLRTVEQEVRQARLGVTHASAAVDASRENVALAVKTLAIARTQYDAGLTTRLEYTEVSLALMQARLNWLYALRDHDQAVNELQYAIGAY